MLTRRRLCQTLAALGLRALLPMNLPSVTRLIPTQRSARSGASPLRASTHHVTGLNPQYTFQNFVVAENNRFAYAASWAVAERPGEAYNPLLIYGRSGLGKTHLLHAIGNFVCQHSNMQVVYVTAEQCADDVINAVRYDQFTQTRKRYQQVDMLLLDDVHPFRGMEWPPEELLQEFVTLCEAGKQVVLSSRLPPRLMPDLEGGLRSKFEWGLIVGIEPPDVEIRVVAESE